MEKERMAAETQDERAATLCCLCVATLLTLISQCSTFIHLVIVILIILYFADVPVFPTVTAVITLQKYMLKEHPIGTFLIPRDYKKVSQCLVLLVLGCCALIG